VRRGRRARAFIPDRHDGAVREQVDWDVVRRRTDGSPYAAAFMTLVERLGVVSPAGERVRGAA
jgi:hypothetical protein